MAHSIEDRELFVDDDDRSNFLSRFEKKLNDCSFQCFAWSLMRNHYHFFIQVNELPLSKLMRPLNGWYARDYNKKYKRHGYLFQDRFKSVLCQDELYAAELIRYIHLNPLRAGYVKSLKELEKYAWCGHGYLMGKEDAKGENFQNRKINWFQCGKNNPDQKDAYLTFLAQGCESEDPAAAGKLSCKEAAAITDSARGYVAVIGDPEFVKKARELYTANENKKHDKVDYTVVLETVSKKVCTSYDISSAELLKKGKRNTKMRTDARAAFCYESHMNELLPLSIIAQHLQMTISPVAALVKKGTPEK
jgi:REP element-mobilizing transposase RayT